MSLKKHFTVVTFCLLVFSHNLFSQIILQGTVTDNGAEYLGSGAEPVVSALVTVTDQADTTRSFSGYTNEQGEYSIVIWATGVGDNNSNNPGRFNLQQNYPNPFNPSTIIGYELTKPTHISIEIYNVLGRKIKTLFDGFQSNRLGQIVWDATDDLGQGVPAGVYVYSLKAEGVRINKKMLLIDGHRGSSNISMSQSRGTNVSRQAFLGKQMSDQYLLQVTGDDFETHEQQNLEIAGNMTLDITVTRTVTDIDGNVYPTVKIGDQWWISENLKVTHYRNGDAIPNVTDDANWSGLTTGAYCNYDNDVNNVETYGRLYNWYAATDSRNIAPQGWHVPTDAEWQTLFDYLGSYNVAGGKMKEAGTTHWASPNTGATNESGFSALPGGHRISYGFFYSIGYSTYFWSTTERNTISAWARELEFSSSDLIWYYGDKKGGFSVRCVRD